MNTKTTNKHTLLLVDDDRLILAAFAQYLAKVGYCVSTAESADDAEAMLVGGVRPDLVILDVNMPGRSGLELAERLQSFDHIPFMLLTAYTEQNIIEQATVFGALGYLVKPVLMRQLTPAIEAALARAAEIRSLRSSEQQFQNILDSDREINIAIGITMVHYKLDNKEALERLRKTARNQCCKLGELAIKVISAQVTLDLGD